MMDRQKGLIIFECDDCGDVFETNEDDFETANKRRRDAGWKTRPKNGDPKSGVWIHTCKDCSS